MRYCCLTIFFRLSIRALVAKIQPYKVVLLGLYGEFLRFFASCIFTKPRAAHFRTAFYTVFQKKTATLFFGHNFC